jgi:nicotinamide mononucleotide (NMN) deamidase PncC
MATAALQQSQADTAIAISGVAGPGHSEGKPAGTVWIGLARRVDGGPQVQSRVAKLGGGRDAVRLRSSLCAMQLLRLWLLGESLDEVTWATPGSAKAEAAPA